MNIEQQAVFSMAEAGNVAASVTLLQSRLDYLGDALEHADTQEAAQPIEAERRILMTTLAAIKAEYTPGYFDSTLDESVIRELYEAAQQILFDTNGGHEKALSVVELIEDGKYLEAVMVEMVY